MNCTVNYKPTRGYLDTGSAAVTIRRDDVDWLGLQPEPSKVMIRGYAGGSVRVLGEVNVTIEVDMAKVDVRALVVPNNVQTIPIMIG